MTADSQEAVARPCMIVAHGDPQLGATLTRAFRRQGWDVYQTRSGPETRRLTRMLEPELLVMAATDLEEETGWLTCEKLTREMPQVKIFLVDTASKGRNENFAAFVGATGLFNIQDGIPTLIQEVCKGDLSAAG
jgi:ActR/RegA family two-component response regulator